MLNNILLFISLFSLFSFPLRICSFGVLFSEIDSFLSSTMIAIVLMHFALKIIFFILLCRKALLLATSIVAVGGTAAAAYVQSRNSRRRQNSFGQSNGAEDIRNEQDQLLGNDRNVKTSRQRRGNLRSLQVLVAILLSRMGRMGAMDILSLLAIAVKFSF